ncbi:MAG TPA: carboxypeptidase-like regulatory domain-containing protein, partial [Vicinamibacterales bacterium]|nr:carboxypeptidase-like regulatory domain-containing protein [Vicinamibacterales bacterium]
MTKSVWAGVTLFQFWLVTAPVQAANNFVSQDGPSSVSGRVVAANGDAPLRHAEVLLFPRGSGDRRRTMTDDEGRYRFRALPMGRYDLSATKEGYLTRLYGQ